MNLHKLSAVLIGTVLGVSASIAAAQAPSPADALAYRAIPGVTPEPIREGAGLKSREELEAFIDGIMAAQLKAQHTAGAVISVVKDGELFFVKGYGYADVEKQIPADGHKTLFRNGSVSKTFTWTALMQLVEQGKVDLDADVNTYLTQFKLPDTYPGKPITLRNVMTHTVGLEDGALGYLIVDTPEQLDPAADALAKHMPLRVRPPTRDFATGDNSAYSNWASELAGLIVANVSGMSFYDYVEKNIFEPLGMQRSTFRQPVPAELLGDVSQGYKYEHGQHKAQKFEYVAYPAAGSMSVTAADMGRFMIAHLQNGAAGAGASGRILKEETAKLMHSRSMSPNPHINGSALGFYEHYVNGRRLIAHGGDLQYFHSDMNLLLEEGVGIFVSVNAAPTLPFSTRGDLLAAFMDRYYPAKLPVLKAPEDFDQRAAKYAGSYRMNRHSHSKNEKVFSMISAFKVMPSDHDTLLVAFANNVWDYVEVAPHTFRRADSGDMIAFVENADGEIRYLLNPVALSFIGAYKLPAWESPVALACILAFALLCFIVAIVSALRHWGVDREAPAGARRARRLAAALAAVNLLFLVGLGVVVASLLQNPVMGYPQSFRIFLALPLLAIPLTLALLVCALLVWIKRYWSGYARVQYTLIALGSLAFLWLLNLGNLIGYNFG